MDIIIINRIEKKRLQSIQRSKKYYLLNKEKHIKTVTIGQIKAKYGVEIVDEYIEKYGFETALIKLKIQHLEKSLLIL